MYELLIRLYYELDYKKYTIKELTEMKDILKEFNGKTLEVRLKKVKEKTNGEGSNIQRQDK